MSRWHEIATEGQPPKDAKYLVYVPSADPEKPFIHVAWYEPDFGWSLLHQQWIEAMTHWMPMPKPPGAERDKVLGFLVSLAVGCLIGFLLGLLMS